MSRSGRLKLQAGLVLVLGGAALIATPPTAEARPVLNCYGYCSEALFDTYCPFPQYPVSSSDWSCPPEAPVTATCGNDS